MQQCTKIYIPLTYSYSAANITWSGWRDVGRDMIRSPTRNRTFSRWQRSERGIYHLLPSPQNSWFLTRNCISTPFVARLDLGQGFSNKIYKNLVTLKNYLNKSKHLFILIFSTKIYKTPGRRKAW
jgi:hypothetical protein